MFRTNRIALASALSALALGLASYPLYACTVFAATGSDFVREGGTLIAKVRDQVSTTQHIKTVRPENGYAYTGLFSGKKNNFNMGVNEKGFVVVRTTAGSVPKKERLARTRYQSPDGLAGQEFLIRHCATVQDALKYPEIFSHEPTNYMMADAKTIAFVEVLPNGQYTVTLKDRATLTHTNHYINEKALPFNRRISRSSQIRLDRINELMTQHALPFSVDDFINLTEDRHGGLDNSIFRIGSKDTASKTVATMVVHLPKKGDPTLYLKWKDDEGTWRTRQTIVQLTDSSFELK